MEILLRLVSQYNIQHELDGVVLLFSQFTTPYGKVTLELSAFATAILRSTLNRQSSVIYHSTTCTKHQLFHTTRVLTVNPLLAPTLLRKSYGSTVRRRAPWTLTAQIAHKELGRCVSPPRCYTRKSWTPIPCLLCTPTTLIFIN